MRIDVLNKAVVLFLRYLYSVKSYWPKIALSVYPARGIFGLPTPPKKTKYMTNGHEICTRPKTPGAPPTHQIWCF